MTDEQRDRMLDRLLENQAIHDAHFRKMEESQAIHEAHFRKMEELQMSDHITINRITNAMAAFVEQHHAALLEIDNGLIRLEALVEAFIGGSRNNGGSKES